MSARSAFAATVGRAKTGSLPIAVTNVVLLCSGVVTGVGVSRALGPEGRGEYVAWQALAAVFALTGFVGCPQSVVLLGREGLRVGRVELSAVVAGAAVVGTMLSAIALAALGDGSIVVLVGVVLVVVSTLFGSLGSSLAQRDGRMTWDFNAARVVPQVAALLAVGVLVLSQSRSSAVWLLFVALCQSAGSFWWFWRHAPGHSPDPHESTRRLARNGLKLGPFTWVSLLQYRGDIVLAGLLLPRSTVAYYAIGLSAEAAVFAVGSAGGMRWFAADNREGRSLVRELGLAVALAVAVALAFALAAPLWVPFLYGEQFAPAVPLVALLSFVGVLQTADYFLVHEGLLRGIGARMALLRLPGVTLLLVVGLFTAKMDQAPYLLALGAGFSFAVSGFVIHFAARRARANRPLESTAETRQVV